MSDTDVKVELDRDVCIGNGMCRAAAPTAFGADADGLAVVEDPKSVSLDVLLDAAASCPVGAIVIRDLASGEPLALPY